MFPHPCFRRSFRSVLIPASLLLAFGLTPAALAELGSFTPADGYNLNSPATVGGGGIGPANWTDVSYFNAGQYGANAGGGSQTLVPPNSGLWKIVGQVGGFFPTAAARTAGIAGYPAAIPPGTVPAYIVGAHFPGRNNDNNNLAVRNDTQTGTGPMQYEYSLDVYDTGGPVPSTVTSGTVTTQFYFCPNPADPPNAGGLPADKFTLSWKDGSGNVGLEWGYARDNTVEWRTGANWNYTSIIADDTNWDGVRVAIDLTNDTFAMDYWDNSASQWLSVVPAGTALGTAMLNFTTLRWQLEDGVTSGTGGKNYFDDFSFNVASSGVVPEPSTFAAGAVLAGVLGLCVRRRGRA